ncbi:MAG: phage head spike fiber domain-containing protein [Bryobacteraceae bacterium]
MILYADPFASRVEWQFSYVNLSGDDLSALKDHFSACAGPVHAFTLIDPTENMLVSSSDVTAGSWQKSPFITFTPERPDPNGGIAAFTLTNTGQAPQEIAQTLTVPSGYQYCFSLYVSSMQPGSISLVRRGSSIQDAIEVPIGPYWNRLVASGRLNDSGNAFTVAAALAPGQQVDVFGFQLEPQISPSGYRPTAQRGGVYPSAHWAAERFTVAAEAPDLFSTSFNIEAVIPA